MRRALLGLTPLLLLAACGDDPSPPTLEAMAGSWAATEVVIVDNADHNNTFDVLAFLGVSVSAVIRADGRLILSLDGTPADTAFVTLSGGVLEWSGDSYNVALNGNNMTWTGVDTYQFDIDGDLTNETVFDRLRWSRN